MRKGMGTKSQAGLQEKRAQLGDPHPRVNMSLEYSSNQLACNQANTPEAQDEDVWES